MWRQRGFNHLAAGREAFFRLPEAREDHIVPWQSAHLSKDLIGKEPRFVLAASGHVAGVINPPARNKRNFWLNENLNGTAMNWLERAEEKPGSWWPD